MAWVFLLDGERCRVGKGGEDERRGEIRVGKGSFGDIEVCRN